MLAAWTLLGTCEPLLQPPSGAPLEHIVCATCNGLSYFVSSNSGRLGGHRGIGIGVPRLRRQASDYWRGRTQGTPTPTAGASPTRDECRGAQIQRLGQAQSQPSRMTFRARRCLGWPAGECNLPLLPSSSMPVTTPHLSFLGYMPVTCQSGDVLPLSAEQRNWSVSTSTAI